MAKVFGTALIAAGLMFVCGMRFQQYLNAQEVRETIELYNRVVKFNNRLVGMMDEVERLQKAAVARCGGVGT